MFQVLEKPSGRVLAAFHRESEAKAELEHLVDAHDYSRVELEVTPAEDPEDEPREPVEEET